MNKIADHIAQVREQIALAARRAGRDPGEITLVGVSKKQPAEAVRDALAAGLTDLGENYVQEAADKREEIAGGSWHLLGHLQSNKAKPAVTLFDLIQSVDSVKLALALDRQAGSIGKVQDILLQVHLGDEATKTGVPPETALDTATEIMQLPNLRLCGLMGIAPGSQEPRPYFQELKRLFEGLPPASRAILSMGMSGDFETAIEEGATMIRVGTAIFGTRITTN